MKTTLSILSIVFSVSFCSAQWVTIPDANFVLWLNDNGFSSCMNGSQMDAKKLPCSCERHGAKPARYRYFPNPVNDRMQITVNEMELGSAFFITNLTGEKVLIGKLLSVNSQIELGKLPNGIYFLFIEGDRSEKIKIVKQ